VHWKRIFNFFCSCSDGDSDDDPTAIQQQGEAEPSVPSTPAFVVGNPIRIINVLGFNSPSVAPLATASAPPPPYNPDVRYEVT